MISFMKQIAHWEIWGPTMWAIYDKGGLLICYKWTLRPLSIAGVNGCCREVNTFSNPLSRLTF